MQKFAFDAYWTGWPFGKDLTDNKTAAAFLIWVGRGVRHPRPEEEHSWALVAAVAMLIVYLIPHSLLGSELDYGNQAPETRVEAPAL